MLARRMATYDAALELQTVVRGHPSDGDPILTNPDDQGFFSLDLAADQAGRLGLVTGLQKLAQQIVIAITGKRMKSMLLGFNLLEYEALVVARLEQFRSNQMRFVAENDPTLLGFEVSRKNRAGDYVLLTQVPIPDIFTDAHVTPGVTYTYRIARRTTRQPGNAVTMEIVEIEIPLAGAQMYDEFDSCAAEATKGSVTFFFPQNRTFRPDEILGQVASVNVREGADPRQVVISIRAKTAAGTDLVLNHVPQSLDEVSIPP